MRAPSSDSGSTIRSRGYLALLATQFLSALNDNMFRWLVVPIGQTAIKPELALSLGGLCFTAPYLLLTPTAGWLGDRFSKRSVIVACKAAEIAIMLLGLLALWFGNVTFLFIVVGLMGAQSALFAPAKYGCLPELLSSSELPRGNGFMGLVTVMATAAGSVAGYWLYSLTEPNLRETVTLGQITPPAIALLGVAVLGFFVSLYISYLQAANPKRPPTFNPITHTLPSLRVLAAEKPIFRAALGIAFFWSVGAIAQLNVDLFGDETLGMAKGEIGFLLAVLIVGVGLGSVLAGLLCGDHVELGIVPLGAFGIAASSCLIYWAGDSFSPGDVFGVGWASFGLLMLGISAGLFDIPLEAYLQQRAPVIVRGTVLAASNFLAFAFMTIAFGGFYVLTHVLGVEPDQVFLVAGIGTIPVMLYALGLLPQATMRFVIWLLTHTLYRVRVIDRENIPRSGGALLVPNHISWVDGMLMVCTTERPIRFVVYATYVDLPIVRQLAKLAGIIPIHGAGGPKQLVKSLEAARKAISRGELVCIFAEGQISRTGQLLPFQRGILRVIEGVDVPVIPVYLGGLWGSIFSYRGGRFFWKRPTQWPYPVTIQVGEPMEDAPQHAAEIRRAVERLGAEVMNEQHRRELIPSRRFIRQCKRSLFQSKMADSSGIELTGGKLLAAVLAFRRALRRTPAGQEEAVGVLLPPSVGGALANLCLAVSGRVSVNLNYTLTDDVMNYCVRRSKLKYVLTSRRFLEKKPFQLDAELIFLEDLKESITGKDRALSALEAFAMPAWALERKLGLHHVAPESLTTIIFTSGSTGEPKGVMLSHRNIASNIEGADQLFNLKPTDTVLGVLPFFHSFGYTGTLWLPLCFPPKAVYHFNPLDARTVGELCEKHHATILLATPTFLKSYAKRCTPEQFAHLDLVVVGAEKMPQDAANEFAEKFGVWPTEGYGCTELSPLAAVNVPDHRSAAIEQQGTKAGTVGRPMPGIAAKIMHPETGEELPIGEPGLLMITGPNVMMGYLEDDEKTAEVIRDGWYCTGDIARIDADGFIEITGRQNRFSKIGGEMVPHIRVEQELLAILEEEEGESALVPLAVSSVADPKRGERLIVLHCPLKAPVEEIVKKLGQRGLPNLWIPSPRDFYEVPEIPILGSGKLDLRGLKDKAEECVAAESVRETTNT